MIWPVFSIVIYYANLGEFGIIIGVYVVVAMLFLCVGNGAVRLLLHQLWHE